MKCDKHPRYKVIRKPTSDCVPCWKIYVEKIEEENKELKEKFINYGTKVRESMCITGRMISIPFIDNLGD